MTDKSDKKVWFITGASRGMGVDFAKAALDSDAVAPRPQRCSRPLTS